MTYQLFSVDSMLFIFRNVTSIMKFDIQRSEYKEKTFSLNGF